MPCEVTDGVGFPDYAAGEAHQNSEFIQVKVPGSKTNTGWSHDVDQVRHAQGVAVIRGFRQDQAMEGPGCDA